MTTLFTIDRIKIGIHTML